MTEQTLPAPLVPDDADLRGFDFMPFYGAWLRSSDFNAICTDAEYRAAVNLWWSSWHQTPPASLPDDDRALCHHADLGRDLKTWAKVKKVAMSGFVLCSDGRWYHEFLSVQARIAWDGRKAAIARGVKSGAARRLKAAARPGTGEDHETLSKHNGNGFEMAANKGSEGREKSPPTPPGNSPGKPETTSAANAGNGRRHRGAGRWRHDPSAAMLKLTELGVSPSWSSGKSHAECVERIQQELQRRERGQHQAGHA